MKLRQSVRIEIRSHNQIKIAKRAFVKDIFFELGDFSTGKLALLSNKLKLFSSYLFSRLFS